MADPIFLQYKDGATISQKEKFVTIIVLVIAAVYLVRWVSNLKQIVWNNIIWI